MTKEGRKETFKGVLLILGFLLISFTLLLYLGGDFMKSCCVVKIICTFMLIVALGGGIIGIWCCTADEDCRTLSMCIEPQNCMINCKDGIVLVKRLSVNSFTIHQYESINDISTDIKTGDVIFIPNRVSIDRTFLEKIKNVDYEIRFSNSYAKIKFIKK